MHSDEWYEVFWENMEVSEEDGVNAVRILGEMFSNGVYIRDGDILKGREGYTFNLSKDDQYLVREIIEATLETVVYDD